jgi:quercetin dioxygenase-like cupin family protein
VHWKGAFAVYGGHGATASSVIVYEIEPGKRLGWHTDATKETQYIIAGSGKLFIEDGSVISIRPGSVFDAAAPRRREYRQGNAARPRFLRRGPCSPRISIR